MIDQQIEKTLSVIRKSSDLKPKIAFVLGSGLASFGEAIEVKSRIPYGDLPGFAASTVVGHPGQLLLGHLHGVPVAVMQGRLHAYEGHPMETVIYPVRVLASLGVKTLMVTNASGGLKATQKPGDFMIIKDHINLTGENPLRGPNWEKGPRFVDMTAPYDPELSRRLTGILRKNRARFHQGVYVGVMGPTYETAAEIRFFAKIGGSAVGMSTVSEVIAARHAGLKVVGLSCITNLGTGLSKKKLSHDDVKDVATRVEKTFVRTLSDFVKELKREL
ncbi:MAG: purine-nucleoside phosphorylase [Bdellovibrionales bacterium]